MDKHFQVHATRRVGFHRYSFPKSDSAHVVIDLAHPDGAEDLIITKVNDHEIEGLRRSHGWAWDQYVYFVAQFSKSFKNFEISRNDALLGALESCKGKNIKAVATFSTLGNESILVRVGISSVSCEGARMNLQTVVPLWNFDEIVILAKKARNHELDRIEVSGGSANDLVQFYTSMYRICISPR